MTGPDKGIIIKHDEELYAVFETLRGKVADTEFYHPCLQVLQNLSAFPRDEAVGRHYWRLVESIIHDIIDKQHSLSGHEAIRMTGDSGVVGGGSLADDERGILLTETMSLTAEYEEKIGELEATVQRLQGKIDSRNKQSVHSGTGTISREEFDAIEERYRDALSAIRLEIAKREAQAKTLTERLRSLMAEPGMTSAAEAHDAQQRHRERMARMARITASPNPREAVHTDGHGQNLYSVHTGAFETAPTGVNGPSPTTSLLQALIESPPVLGPRSRALR